MVWKKSELEGKWWNFWREMEFLLEDEAAGAGQNGLRVAAAGMSCDGTVGEWKLEC